MRVKRVSYARFLLDPNVYEENIKKKEGVLPKKGRGRLFLKALLVKDYSFIVPPHKCKMLENNLE